MPRVAFSVDRSESAAASGYRPTRTARSTREGNASASASETTIGKPKVQNTASGSRMNSRIRASVNWTSGRSVRLKADTTLWVADEDPLLIAQMPSR